MKPVKHIEVILPEAILQVFTDMIETQSFEAYSVYTGLSGKSRRGVATAGLSDASVTILCDQIEADRLIPKIAEFLERYGGVGCVIEAQGFSITTREHSVK